MKRILLFIVLISTFCFPAYCIDHIPKHLLGISKEDIRNEGWRVGTTKRFDTFEDFFSKHDMHAVYRTGYLYDISAEKIVAYQEAIKKFTALDGVLFNRGLEIKVSKADFITLTNIEFPESSDVHYLYFYFDNPFQENSDTLFSYINHPKLQEELQKSRERRINAANVLKQQRTIPWYLVKIPKVGIKYQKF